MNTNTILNLEAINSKLKLYFQPQGVNTKVSSKNNCLQILLESANVPEKEKCIKNKTLTAIAFLFNPVVALNNLSWRSIFSMFSTTILL